MTADGDTDGSGRESATDPAGLPAEVDVLVVGYGPVGAAIANLLGRYGARSWPSTRPRRSSWRRGLSPSTTKRCRVLQLAGLEEGDFDKVAIPYVRMLSPQLGEFGRINTLGQIDGHPKLVTFYQPELEAVLRRRCRAMRQGSDRARRRPDRLRRGRRSSGRNARPRGGRTASTVRARYLVGADGASSLVRQLIGQDFNGQTYGEDWLVVDARGAQKPIDHIEFLCDWRRPTPHMTAPGGRERWEFMLRPGETRAEMESDATREQTARAVGRPVGHDDRAQGGLPLSRPHSRRLPQGPGLPGWRRRPHHPALRRSGAGRRLAGRGESVVEARLGRSGPRLGEHSRELRRGAAPARQGDDRPRQVHGPARSCRRAPGARFSPMALMRLMRLTAPMRRYFDELGIKPKNVFARRASSSPGRSGVEAQARRSAAARAGCAIADGDVRLSDEALGAYARADRVREGRRRPCSMRPTAQRLRRLRRQGRPDRASRAGAAPSPRRRLGGPRRRRSCPASRPSGWAAVVRPDRTVLHDGPAAEVDRLVRESLALMANAVARRGASGAEFPSCPFEEVFTMQLTTPQPARHPNPTTKAVGPRLCDLRSPRPQEGRRISDRFRAQIRLERRRNASDARNRSRIRTATSSIRRRSHASSASGSRSRALPTSKRCRSCPARRRSRPCALPGGGQCVRLTDPSGFRVDAIFGRALSSRAAASSADAAEFHRPAGADQRNAAPARSARPT